MKNHDDPGMTESGVRVRDERARPTGLLDVGFQKEGVHNITVCVFLPGLFNVHQI